MKHLVILGVPRAGKSYLSTRVVKQLDKTTGKIVVLLPADDVIGALNQSRRTLLWRIFVRPLRHTFPFVKRASKEHLVHNALVFVKSFIGLDNNNQVVVFEGAYFSPEYIHKHLRSKNIKIVVVGYPNADVEQKVADIRKYDKGRSPLSKKSDIELRAAVNNLIEQSRQYEQMAKKYKLTFLDTSNDYHGTLDRFAENIVKFLSE